MFALARQLMSGHVRIERMNLNWRSVIADDVLCTVDREAAHCNITVLFGT